MNLMLDDYDLIKNSLPDFAFITALVSKTMHECNDNDKDKKGKETIDEPKTFQEAWNNPNKDHQLKWREAIKKELRDMINHGVFRKVKRSSMPTRKRCVKTNGCSRSRGMESSAHDLLLVDTVKSWAWIFRNTSHPS